MSAISSAGVTTPNGYAVLTSIRYMPMYALLPLKISESQARDLIRQWYGRQWLAPNNLNAKALTDKEAAAAKHREQKQARKLEKQAARGGIAIKRTPK